MPGRPRPGYHRASLTALDRGCHALDPTIYAAGTPRGGPCRVTVIGSGRRTLITFRLLSQPGVIERASYGPASASSRHPRGRPEQNLPDRQAAPGGASVCRASSDNYCTTTVGPVRPCGIRARLAEFLDHVDVAVSLHGYDHIAAPSCWPRPATRACRPSRAAHPAARLIRVVAIWPPSENSAACIQGKSGQPGRDSGPSWNYRFEVRVWGTQYPPIGGMSPVTRYPGTGPGNCGPYLAAAAVIFGPGSGRTQLVNHLR